MYQSLDCSDSHWRDERESDTWLAKMIILLKESNQTKGCTSFIYQLQKKINKHVLYKTELKEFHHATTN